MSLVLSVMASAELSTYKSLTSMIAVGHSAPWSRQACISNWALTYLNSKLSVLALAVASWLVKKSTSAWY